VLKIRGDDFMKVAILTAMIMAGSLWCATPPVFSEENGLQRVVVEMTEYSFSPKEIVLQAGVETEMVLVNRGAYVHEFVTPYLQDVVTDVQVQGAVIETLGVAEVEVEPGHEIRLIFTPEKQGTFPFSCHAMEPQDHYEKGMGGILVVK
jgi:uncharacterized cupredoxin-like copper-binding protein